MHENLTCSTGFRRCLGFFISRSFEFDTVIYARVKQNAEYV